MKISVNKFRDVPSMHFIVPFSGLASMAAKVVRHHFGKLQETLPEVYPHNLVTAYSRNKNIKDKLVSSHIRNVQNNNHV